MRDDQFKSSLPTWIPEGLLIAESLRASAADKAASVLDGTTSPNGEKLSSDESEKLERIKNSIRVSPQVSAETVLAKMGFSSENAKKTAFF